MARARSVPVATMPKRSQAAKGTKRVAVVPHTAAHPLAEIYWALLLAIAACALYAPSWHHGFVGDDSFVTWNNAWTRQGLSALPRIVSHSAYFGSVPQHSGLYRPAA